jgi:hypothetical protein
VILSLLFVGFEIRQNTAVARGQARHALAELNQEWRSGFDPAFVEFFEDAMGLSSGREEHGP